MDYLNFTSFPTNAHFLSQDPVQVHTLHLGVVVSVLQSVTVPHTFLIFHDLKSFEEYWVSL